MEAEMTIYHGNIPYQPVLCEGVSWQTERAGSPGKLTFSIIDDGIIQYTEGDSVAFRVDGTDIFFGFIFTIKHGTENKADITAYDQLRYLKNKDTYVYKDKTASTVIKMIADDFLLKAGKIEDTKFIIAKRVEDGSSLFDIIGNALDLTLMNRGVLYILYDDFGRLALKSIDNMHVDVLINNETCQGVDYSTSIDSGTYNKVKLTFSNEDSGMRDIYIAQDGGNMEQWGVLQYTDTIKEGENGDAKADAMLNLYNAKTKSLKVSGALGHLKVRAGSLVGTYLKVGDMLINSYMMVEKCTHNFKLGEHLMDLELRGGEING